LGSPDYYTSEPSFLAVYSGAVKEGVLPLNIEVSNIIAEKLNQM
jgi:hypothetical protein